MQTLRPVSNSPVHAVGDSSLASHKSLKVLLLNTSAALGLASTQKKQSLPAENDSLQHRFIILFESPAQSLKKRHPESRVLWRLRILWLLWIYMY